MNFRAFKNKYYFHTQSKEICSLLATLNIFSSTSTTINEFYNVNTENNSIAFNAQLIITIIDFVTAINQFLSKIENQWKN